MTDHSRAESAKWPAAVALATAVALVGVGCDGDPFAFDWDETPDTVFLYSLARPELNLESGFAFLQGLRVRIEDPLATGAWDAAVDTRGGELVLLPPGALGVNGTARIATIGGMALEDVTEAPADTLVYVANTPVPLAMGTIYIVKTNRQPGNFGSSCVYYAKLEPVILDVAGGTLTFRHVTNPVCNSRDLVPPR